MCFKIARGLRNATLYYSTDGRLWFVLYTIDNLELVANGMKL